MKAHQISNFRPLLNSSRKSTHDVEFVSLRKYKSTINTTNPMLRLLIKQNQHSIKNTMTLA